MVIITAQEAARRISPVFAGRKGKLLFDLAAGVTGISKLNALHEQLDRAGIPYGPQFAKAILKNNRDYAAGDQLTFVVGRQTEEASVPRASFVCHTVVLDLFSDQPLAEAVGGSDGFEVRGGVLASQVTTGAATWVHERPTADGETLVSTQRLWCDNEEMIAHYTSPEALERAASTYNKGKVDFLTPEPTLADTAGKL